MQYVITTIGALSQAAATWKAEQIEPGSTPPGTPINIQIADGTEVTFVFDPTGQSPNSIIQMGSLGEAAATYNEEIANPGTVPSGSLINIQLADNSEVTFVYQPGSPD